MKKESPIITLLEYFATIWAYVAIALVTFTFFWLELILFIFLFPFDKQRYFVGRLFRLSSVVSLKLNPLFTFKVIRKEPKFHPQQTVQIRIYNNNIQF